MKSLIYINAIILTLSVGIILVSTWRLNQRALSVFDARTEGFAAGIASAHADQQSVAKLGLCSIAALECKGRH